MEIKPDFSALRKVAEILGAKIPQMNFGHAGHFEPAAFVDLDQRNVIDINFAGGVLSYKGQQVLLYIADQGGIFFDVLKNPELGKRFHLTNCSTIEDMRSKGRYKRYVATNNTSGKFQVIGSTSNTIDKADRLAKLVVCQNCLKKLNYKGYLTEPRRSKDILENFDIDSFFAGYSTVFEPKPFDLPSHSHYPSNWKDISRKYRSSKNYRCEKCRLSLKQNQSLLHSHHKNGNKYECDESNLQALCEDCHRKMPFHEHMPMSASRFLQIQSLRCEQKILSPKNWGSDGWDEAIAYADRPFEGLLRTYRSQGREAPELHISISVSNGNPIIVDIAWPGAKQAIAATDKDKVILKKSGWKLTTLGAAQNKEYKGNKTR